MSSPSSSVSDPTLRNRNNNADLNELEQTVVVNDEGRELSLTNARTAEVTTPVTTYDVGIVDVNNSNGEKLGEVTVTHNGEQFVMTADPQYGDQTQIMQEDLSPEDVKGFLDTGFPERPRSTNPGGGGGGGTPTDPPGGCTGMGCSSCSGGPGCRD